MRLAVERHVRDLETGKARGLFFDPDEAFRPIQFFHEFCRHSKGEWAGKPIILDPWQQFTLWVLFGWRRSDGTRRFRTAYEQVGRKNGKSTKGAGVGLYMMLADGEPGSEVYCAATMRDQARIVHEEAVRMVKKSPLLKKYIQTFADNLSVEETSSKFEPLGKDSDNLDGLNPHCGIIDEVHAHKNRGIYDVIQTAMGSRRQPLLYAITTAGFDRKSLCYELREFAQKVLEGVIEKDDFFAYVAEPDEGDDWKDPACFVKGNPNLGVSVKLESLLADCETAKEQPGYVNTFRRLRLNEWTESSSRWLSLEKWDACRREMKLSDFKARPGFLCFDLGSKDDLASVALAFPEEIKPEESPLPVEDAPLKGPEPEASPGEAPAPPRLHYLNKRIFLFVVSFCPEEKVRERSRKGSIPYDRWVREGHLIPTPGAMIDYAYIRAYINRLKSEGYDIREVGGDPWNATYMLTELAGDGFTVFEFRQGWQSISAPTKDFGALIAAGRLHHDGNGCLRWMASNVTVRQDPAGNLKPDKEKSGDKIDGIVAGLMAAARALLANPEAGRSVYETRGILTL